MTIEITDEMVDASAAAVDNLDPKNQVRTAHIKAALAAAAPHLRAAWEREMVEKIRAKFLGPDFGRNPVNGQDSPDAALHAAYDEGLQTALALLEGGGE